MDTLQMEKILEQYEEIKDEAHRVYNLIYKDKASREGSEYRDYSGSLGSIEPQVNIDGGMVEMTWEENHCSCCSPDYMEDYFPTEYLFNDDWRVPYEAKINKQEKDKIERERIATEKSIAAKKERERKQYLELKAKFGGE